MYVRRLDILGSNRCTFALYNSSVGVGLLMGSEPTDVGKTPIGPKDSKYSLLLLKGMLFSKNL